MWRVLGSDLYQTKNTVGLSSLPRRITEEGNHVVSDAQVEVLEAITRKASIKKAKKMADDTQKEYIQDEAKARSQEAAVRKAHQKEVDKAMAVRERERIIE